MPAKITNIEALRDFRAKLMQFAEEVDASLQMLQSESLRAIEWIEHDRPHYWTAQVRRAFEQISAARSALASCQMRAVAGHRPACIEEKQMLNAAKRRLEHCQEQVRGCKRLAVRIHHDVDEFRGRMAGLQRMLISDVPKALALLEKTSAILEAYSETDGPSA